MQVRVDTARNVRHEAGRCHWGFYSTMFGVGFDLICRLHDSFTARCLWLEHSRSVLHGAARGWRAKLIKVWQASSNGCAIAGSTNRTPTALFVGRVLLGGTVILPRVPVDSDSGSKHGADPMRGCVYPSDATNRR
jgi:hypothetical protein